ncbi:MAG: ATP-binding protein [Spartobacteria bacterium]|nr:ATP-binding protein [Spartobacteria bacterium]
MKTMGHYHKPDNTLHEMEVLFNHSSDRPFHWGHCDLTAQTAALFFAAFFPVKPEPGFTGRDEILFSVNYIANELLENAHKFGCGDETRFRAAMTATDLLLWVDNATTSESGQKLESLINEMLQGDPQDLLLERIERNVMEPDSSGSGLGYLTMMSDYGVRFGWMLGRTTDPLIRLETQAWLPVQRKD